MADDLTRPYIGYRSAGRRPERQQDRRASADAPLAALRGMVSGVLGAPGDIESLVRMLPGLSEQTMLPTSEDVERRLPLRSVSETPAGRAFTTAGQLGGGFYTGPGSPLRAIAAMPSAVSRAGREFLVASGQPAVNVVKPKGGNWLNESVQDAIRPLRQTGLVNDVEIPYGPAYEEAARQRIAFLRSAAAQPTYRGGAETSARVLEADLNTPRQPEMAINRWLETKLAKYIRNEMGTPEDPIRALAEKGPIHTEISPTGYNVTRARREAGFPEEGMGMSPLAKTWEARADTFVNPLKASDLTSGYYREAVEANPWLLKVPPETPVYEMLRGSEGDIGLGFGHLVDELKNAINPASGLPENLRWKYQDLEKVTVPQAVQRVADINAWRAAQKVEADMARAMGPATHVFKEYPEQGFKWVELKAPKETGRKISVEKPEMDLPPDFNQAMGREVAEDMAFDEGLEEGTREFNDFVQRTMADFNRKKKVEMDESYKALEDALKYEGETMGHCVGGYCPDVIEGRSKIFSLRDKKGQPHVTIETRPGNLTPLDLPKEIYDEYRQSMAEGISAHGGRPGAAEWLKHFHPEVYEQIKPPDEIVQIKGKANRAPNPEYLPAVQDFVRSGNWSKVGDLQNTGLISYKGEYRLPEEFLYRTDEGGWEPLVDVAKRAFPDSPAKQLNFFRGASELENDIKLKPQGEGFAEGGLVGGANSPTLDFDPARIDTIVGELHALNAG